MSGGGAGLGERGCGADAHAGCGRDSVVRGVDQRLRDSRPHCKAYESEKASRVALPTWPEPVQSHTGSFREFIFCET